MNKNVCDQSARSHLLSILCVAYNHAQFAEHALDSIFAQTYRNIEIVVLDDGSDDDTLGVLRASLKNSPFPFKLIEQENSGKVGLNFNRARSAASGSLLGFLSLDDRLKENFAESHVQALSSDEEMVFSVDVLRDEIDEAGALIKRDVPDAASLSNFSDGTDLYECEYATLATFYIQSAVIRADAFDDIGGFDNDMNGDDLILRTKLFRYLVENPSLRFSLHQRTGFEYRLHSNNLHKNYLHQIRTCVEWRNRYFSNRLLPMPVIRCIQDFVDYATAKNDPEGIQQAAALDDDVGAVVHSYKKSFKFHRRRLKSVAKKMMKKIARMHDRG